MTTSAEVRTQIVDAVRLDLIGPRPDDPDHVQYRGEMLPIAPSKWYLTGFLVPYEAPVEKRSDDDGDDVLDEAGPRAPGDDDSPPEAASARKAYFPSSMGLSVLVPKEAKSLRVRLTWGDYVPDEQVEAPEQADGDGHPRRVWRRVPREVELDLPLRAGDDPPLELAESGGLRVVVSTRPTGTSLLPAGTRSVSVFLVNHRAPAEDSERDRAYVFQPELTLAMIGGLTTWTPETQLGLPELPAGRGQLALQANESAFVPRPDQRGHGSDDWDERVADLQYRDVMEYAVGHNVSAVALLDGAGGCQSVRTSWMPRALVEKVEPASIPNVELRMAALAEVDSHQALLDQLGSMVTEYTAWIERQVTPEDPRRAKVARSLLDNAARAGKRIQAGLDALSDPRALDAFRITNRAVRTAIVRRDPNVADPAWRPFQLAFVLMNLPAVVDPKHADREVVDLLFFPTGGGKTEAYLGLAAFTMVLRRMKDPSIHSAGLSVIMRYTLRLLTLDQLGRAATLMCALELERQSDVQKLGLWPFEVGLWVGQTATPNRMGKKGKDNKYSARRRTMAFLDDHKRKPSPIPLENCPWCGTKFSRESFQLLPNADEPTDLRVFCSSRTCDFHPRRQARGLPILAVDEPIYQRLPAFIIATVDKFANLPWVGETAGLFGRVQRYDMDRGFYGPSQPGMGRPLDGPLPPPDLVIQDELHLISGPLGTLVGLYETAIDALCAQPVGGPGVRPKIVASTATVRRAEKQIRGLFGRSAVEIFPPPGPNRRDSFFAKTVSVVDKNARMYLGIAAQGRNLKVVLLRTYVALLAAAQRAWRDCGGEKTIPNPADPYMTVLGYFSSLRELGGSRRIVEDEVKSRLVDYGTRRRRVGEQRGLFENRKKLHDVRELTSRVSTNEVAETKRRLALGFDDAKERLDVALATNMISVGLDITRLGLMVVLGQPKTASEYIQATSRVGRDDKRPGLVVTLLNVHRHRDRSHYERFTAWHDSFYSKVEATSVTPFSPRAIDRGIAGVTVALARLGLEGMTAPLSASAIQTLRSQLDFVAEVISRRAEGHDKELSAAEAEQLRQRVKKRVEALLDTWVKLASDLSELQYQSETGRAQRLLYDPLDPELAKRPKEASWFKAQRSLRDVEPTVNLRLRNPDGLEVDELS